jgi:hypothetical protein
MAEQEQSTVAFVQEWMMSGDHEPDQWHRDFAAAIDARTPTPDAVNADKALAFENLRLAYKTGYSEGYIDATDDGTGNGYSDHDAAEEGWQQYKERGFSALLAPEKVAENSSGVLGAGCGGISCTEDNGTSLTAVEELQHCGLPCGFDCNHPDGCLLATPAPDKVLMPAVGEALEANEWLEWTRFEGGFPGAAEIRKQHAIIRAALATPTTIKNAATRDSLVHLIETRLLGVAPDDQDLVLEDHDWRRIIAALAATNAEQVKGKLPRLTKSMMIAACKAHYGDDNIDGISMTVDGVDHSFRQAFKRMWSGIRAALKANGDAS